MNILNTIGCNSKTQILGNTSGNPYISEFLGWGPCFTQYFSNSSSDSSVSGSLKTSVLKQGFPNVKE